MGLVDRDDGWRMPDWLWEWVEPMLPPPPEHPLGTHRQGLPKRQVMDAILLVLRTGMQWNALDATGVCNSSTAHRRFQEWERAGVFHEIWRQGLLDYDEHVGIDWSWLAADGAMTKAPLGDRRPAPIPLIEPRGGEAFAPRRGAWRPDRDRPRRREPQRPPPAERYTGLRPDRAPGADRGRSPGSLPGQGLRQPRGPRSTPGARLHPSHPPSRRGDRPQAAQPRLAGPPLGHRGVPLVAEPQPGNPRPLVQERREPPRPPTTRQRHDRLQ